MLITSLTAWRHQEIMLCDRAHLRKAVSMCFPCTVSWHVRTRTACWLLASCTSATLLQLPLLKSGRHSKSMARTWSCTRHGGGVKQAAFPDVPALPRYIQEHSTQSPLALSCMVCCKQVESLLSINRLKATAKLRQLPGLAFMDCLKAARAACSSESQLTMEMQIPLGNLFQELQAVGSTGKESTSSSAAYQSTSCTVTACWHQDQSLHQMKRCAVPEAHHSEQASGVTHIGVPDTKPELHSFLPGTSHAPVRTPQAGA